MHATLASAWGNCHRTYRGSVNRRFIPIKFSVRGRDLGGALSSKMDGRAGRDHLPLRHRSDATNCKTRSFSSHRILYPTICPAMKVENLVSEPKIPVFSLKQCDGCERCRRGADLVPRLSFKLMPFVLRSCRLYHTRKVQARPNLRATFRYPAAPAL
jgi:hypothetical protein